MDQPQGIELFGHTVEDVITGYKGVVTGWAGYITGCNQVLVVAKMKKGAYQEGRWFDEQRVRVKGSTRLALPEFVTNRGADTVAPGGSREGPPA